MQRASKQCVVWGNSWARILGARVVVGGGAPKCLLPRRVRGARTTVLGLVERVVTVGLGFGEKVTAGAENFPPHTTHSVAPRASTEDVLLIRAMSAWDRGTIGIAQGLL